MSNELRAANPIDVMKAIDQHGAYMEALSLAVSSNPVCSADPLVLIDADEKHPDCGELLSCGECYTTDVLRWMYARAT